MNPKNSVIALSIGIVLGGLAFFLLYQKASELEQKTTPVEVLVASRYIPPGSFLKADMVVKKSIPESFVSPSAIRDLKEIEGLANLVGISGGEQILANKFGAGEESLAFALNPGYRAYTLEVNETSGVGDLIHPGNHVDILTKTESNKRTVTSYVFQNVEVLAVGQKLNLGQKENSNPDSSRGGNNTESSYSTVTLSVTPEQAETLMYLDGSALRLVLRAPSDNDIVSVAPQSESEVMSKLGHFTARAGKSIEIIRGNSKQGE